MGHLRVPASSLVLRVLRLVTMLAMAAMAADIREHEFTVSSASCAAVDDGYVYCWGSNYKQMLGKSGITESNTPVKVEGPTNVIAVKASNYHVCSLSLTGEVYCWGAITSSASINSPYKFFGNLRAKALAVTDYGTCIVTTGSPNTVYCIGKNAGHRFSTASTSNSYSYPERVTYEDVEFSYPVISEESVCALRASGDTVWCRGDSEMVGLLQDETAPMLTCHKTHCCHRESKLWLLWPVRVGSRIRVLGKRGIGCDLDVDDVHAYFFLLY